MKEKTPIKCTKCGHKYDFKKTAPAEWLTCPHCNNIIILDKKSHSKYRLARFVASIIIVVLLFLPFYFMQISFIDTGSYTYIFLAVMITLALLQKSEQLLIRLLINTIV